MRQDYQVIPRRFRPQRFSEVYGQDPTVTTLKNSISSKRIGQAYLFSGGRGTGKTTLARLFAKAINCHSPDANLEPCNACPSCLSILNGSSLDVLEIDGASNRGIEDIRQINETVGYLPSLGRYKIYIIDEVHMLTKEAFNALLKTLEEPPPTVKFFFATTEVHKIPLTILSRCQRFPLRLIPQSLIERNLSEIAAHLNIEIAPEALSMIAKHAEGSLRDAQSLFDQILSFEEGTISLETVCSALGTPPNDLYFAIDQAGKAGRFGEAFDIAHQLISGGYESSYFFDGWIDHLRQLLMCKISNPNSLPPSNRYLAASTFYSTEQLIQLIQHLLTIQPQLRTTSFPRTLIEMTILHVMRSHLRVPIEELVNRLSLIEKAVIETSPIVPILSVAAPQTELPIPPPILTIEPTLSPPQQTVPHPLEPPKTTQPAPKLQSVDPDTLIQFAALELGGRLVKQPPKPSS